MTALAYDVTPPCRGLDHLFHGPDQEQPGEKRAREAEAKAVCFGCPTAVRESCLQIAMTNERGLSAGNRNGIYGGLNEKERADLDDYDPRTCGVCEQVFDNPKARAAHARIHRPIPHGTETGHSRHKSRGEQPCEECRIAHNDYNTEKRKRAVA